MAVMRGTRTVTSKVGAVNESFQQSEVYISDYRWIIKQLNEIDKEILKEFRRNQKRIAKPVQQGIRKNIPLRAPLRGSSSRRNGKRYGMQQAKIPGRLTWGNIKPARSALIRARNPKKFTKSARTAIVAVDVVSPATVMADMAGKSNQYINSKPRTEPYRYTLRNGEVIMRTHRIRNQGLGMIRALNKVPSRFVYPGALSQLDKVAQEMSELTEDALDTIKRRMDS